MAEVKLMTLDPGHFHASLIQKEMYPNVSKRVDVYAPLGPDLIEHLGRIARFNLRPDNPTAWELEIHCSPDFMARMLEQRPGNVVVLSGRNRGKIDHIKASIAAGLNVLADKPWIIASTDLPQLEAALDAADRRGLVAYDIMTERYEITSILQRELVNDADTFGAPVPGAAQEPGVYMESVHHIMKTVAGVPSLRPLSFFDIHQQGEGLSDVGTHLVDLVQWVLFPDQALDYRRDLQVLSGRHWPTVISRAEFQRVTGEAAFPEYLAEFVKGDRLEYFCNNQVYYTLRGVHTKLDVLWKWEAPAGAGDTHLAIFRGTKSRIEIRQSKPENYRPEIYVIPNNAAGKREVQAALSRKIERLQASYPGITLEDQGAQIRITIPDRYRVGHEAHFAQVTNRFFEYLKAPQTMPAWEKPNMLAKHYVSTRGVELSREGK
jgi:predicted dehydrogenase